MAKTLTLRLPEDDQFHKNLKWCADKLGEKTSTKTFVASVNVLPVYMKMSLEQQSEIDSLQNEIKRLNSIIDQGRLSALAFADALSQDDLLSKS